MTRELIEEARRVAGLVVSRNWGNGGTTSYEDALREMCIRLADALAARQPAEGDREANEAVAIEWIAAQRVQGWPDMHPEDYCHKCGAKNFMWAANREDWEAATSAWAAETGREGICCIDCFIGMYREQSGDDPVWVLSRHMSDHPENPTLATCVPVQGEPNDDQERIAAILQLRHPGNMYSTCERDADAILAAGFSRATVPDATTEPKNLSIMNGWLVELVGEHTCGTGPDGYYGAHEPGCGYEPHLNLADLEGWPGAERDAALAAVERLKVWLDENRPLRCTIDYGGEGEAQDDYEVIMSFFAALDGAPDPEWEYVGMAFEHGGFMRIRNDQLVPEKFESWRKLMSQYPRVEILKRVKAVPAGPWLPVEGESKP